MCKTMIDEFVNNMESIVSDRVQKEFENRFSIKCLNCKVVNLTHSKYCNTCGCRTFIKLTNFMIHLKVIYAIPHNFLSIINRIISSKVYE